MHDSSDDIPTRHVHADQAKANSRRGGGGRENAWGVGGCDYRVDVLCPLEEETLKLRGSEPA